jgi:hypothetical protein
LRSLAEQKAETSDGKNRSSRSAQSVVEWVWPLAGISGWQKNEVEGIAGESATGDWKLGTWKLGTEGAGRFTQYVQNFNGGAGKKEPCRRALHSTSDLKGTQ